MAAAESIRISERMQKSHVRIMASLLQNLVHLWCTFAMFFGILTGKDSIIGGVQPVYTRDADVLLNDFRDNIYNGVDPGYSTWKRLADCSSWTGVTCDSNGRVTAIQLQGSALSGNLPDTLGSLTNLQNLDLFGNNLEGYIPNTLGNLKKLLVLSLGVNALSGSIPDTLGNLKNLQLLFLNNNALSGSIPNSMGSLTNLQHLHLFNNALIGSIPNSMGNLTNLQRGSLSNNALSGIIPGTLGSLVNLQSLLLDNNALSGNIPNQMGSLKNLQNLILNNNALSGSIPSALGSLKNLQHLTLNNNALSGTIPSTLGSLEKLQYLALNNNALSGNIPNQMGSLKNLQYFILNNNALSGSIPSTLGSLKNLQHLVLNNNALSGNIPNTIGSLKNLTHLDLSHNALNGIIPSTVGNLKILEKLYLHTNTLSGNIPNTLGTLTNLTDLNLSLNYFSGSIPIKLFNIPLLDFSANCLNDTSQYQRSTSECSSFCDAYQSGGPCSGHGSCVLSEFVSSCMCNAGYNNQTGENQCVTSVFVHPQDAAILLNDFKGNINNGADPGFPTWKSTSFCVHWRGVTCDKNGRVTKILLYNSRLSGNIPESLGSLTNLEQLDLYNNALSGDIPDTLGKLTKLQVLYLNFNFFSGIVPNTLSNGPDIDISTNCLDKIYQYQRSTSECSAFCDAYQSGGSCSGHGSCILSESSSLPLCICDVGYSNQPGGFQCIATGFQLGLVIPEVGINPKSQSHYFRYASSGFGSTTQSFTWAVQLDWDWNMERAVGAVRDQKQCRSCHAFAAAAAMESSFYILNYGSKQAFPKISVQQLLDCPLNSGKCKGGWPTTSLDYAATNTMFADVSYPYLGTNRSCFKPSSSVKYTIQSYESVQFYGWLGLLLAVQQQPVLVHVEGSGVAFQNYVQGIFSDTNCYSNGVDHTMLLVGYHLGTNPYWILKNSWGTKWGASGYMKMAITDGEGICGINTLPGYIPIFLKVDDPCNMNSYAKLAVSGNEDNVQPGRMNPCGGHTCIPGKKGSALRNTCNCAESRGYFVAANNTDGTQTCVPASPCTFTDTNPCGVGRCFDLKTASTATGKYSCMCPIGYLVGKLTTSGSPTCLPAASVVGIRSYKVPTGAIVHCEDMYQLYGLTSAEFLKQNSGVDCKKPFPVGKVLNTSSTYLRGCEVSYVVQKGDSCKSLITLFGTTTAKLKLANPSLNCSVTTLLPGQLVCIQRYRNNAQSPNIPLCTKVKRVSLEDLNCATIINTMVPKNATKFFSMNPGLNCNNLKPKVGTSSIDSKFSYEICVEASDFGALKQGCTGKFVPFKLSGQTCNTIYKVYFQNSQSLFLKANKQISCKMLLRHAKVIYAKTNRVIGFCRT